MDQDIQKKLDEFFSKCKSQDYKKGDILIRADEEPQGIFYLTKGSIKQYAVSQKGEESVVNIFKPISFFPMSWAINSTPNAYYFETLETVKGKLAPREEVINFLKGNPDILYNLMSRVFKGTDGLLMRMVYLMSGEAYARVIIELLIQAKRFGKSQPGNKTITLYISETDIANQAGMVRETVSREIKLLKDKGLVSFEKSVLTINNLSSLEEELSNL